MWIYSPAMLGNSKTSDACQDVSLDSLLSVVVMSLMEEEYEVITGPLHKEKWRPSAS